MLKPTRRLHPCQRTSCPSTVKLGPSGWEMWIGRTSSRSVTCVRAELPVALRERDGIAVLEVHELAGVHVDEAEHALDRSRVRVAARAGPHVGEHAREPPLALLLRRAVGPGGDGVDVDRRDVGDAPAAQRGEELGSAAHGRLDPLELLDGHRRLDARALGRRGHGDLLEVDDELPGHTAARVVQADLHGARVGTGGAARRLRGGHRHEPDAVLPAVPRPHDARGLRDLVRAKRVERVGRRCTRAHGPSGSAN